MCKKHHRDYTRAHYAANKQYYVDKAARHNAAAAKLVREAKSVSCMDCGNTYPYYVMDFDHRENKEFTLGGSGSKSGRQKILAEIEKCDVVCSNCHRIRTATRAGYHIEMDSGIIVL